MIKQEESVMLVSYCIASKARRRVRTYLPVEDYLFEAQYELRKSYATFIILKRKIFGCITLPISNYRNASQSFGLSGVGERKEVDHAFFVPVECLIRCSSFNYVHLFSDNKRVLV